MKDTLGLYTDSGPIYLVVSAILMNVETVANHAEADPTLYSVAIQGTQVTEFVKQIRTAAEQTASLLMGMAKFLKLLKFKDMGEYEAADKEAKKSAGITGSPSLLSCLTSHPYHFKLGVESCKNLTAIGADEAAQLASDVITGLMGILTIDPQTGAQNYNLAALPQATQDAAARKLGPTPRCHPRSYNFSHDMMQMWCCSVLGLPKVFLLHCLRMCESKFSKRLMLSFLSFVHEVA